MWAWAFFVGCIIFAVGGTIYRERIGAHSGAVGGTLATVGFALSMASVFMVGS